MKPSQQCLQQSATTPKIQAYLRTISALEQQTSALQSQLIYCETTLEWLNNIFTPVGKPAANMNMKSLMSSSSKLTILEKEAIFANCNNSQKSRNSEDKGEKERDCGEKCKVSAHLEELLREDIEKKKKIQQLLQTRQQLYTRIQQQLTQQQPYLHQKMLKKIQRQLQNHCHTSTLKQLQKICSQKQEWLSSTKTLLSSQIDQKTIQNKVTNNLQKMKEIMGRKIGICEHVGVMVGDCRARERLVGRLVGLGKEIAGKVRGEIDKMGDQGVERELQERRRQKEARNGYVEFDAALGDEIGQLMREGSAILMEPLGTPGTRQLSQYCDRLTQDLNTLLNHKY